jgi:hypothetical protein
VNSYHKESASVKIPNYRLDNINCLAYSIFNRSWLFALEKAGCFADLAHADDRDNENYKCRYNKYLIMYMRRWRINQWITGIM